MNISATSPNAAGYPDRATLDSTASESLRNGPRSNARGTDSLDIGKSNVGATAIPGPSEEMLKQLVEELQALAIAQSKENGDDGVLNRRGAPALYAPEGDVSGIDMTLRMMCLTILSQENQMNWTATNLEAFKVRLEKNTQYRMAKQQEINAKIAEDTAHEKSAKVWDWVGKIAAVIGAVAAVVMTAAGTVASGGAGTVLLAISVMALINTTMSLADEISKANGGPEISLTNLISSTIVPVFEKFGLEHDTAQKVVIGLAAVPLFVIEPQMLGTTVEEVCKSLGVSEDTAKICGQVVVVAATIAVGIVVIGASLLATGGTAALPVIARVAYGLLQSSAQLAKGGASIAQGSLKISSAMTMKEVAYIEADRMDLEAAATMLRKQMDADQETLKNLLQDVQKGMRAATQVIKDLYDSQSQISRNIGQRSPV